MKQYGIKQRTQDRCTSNYYLSEQKRDEEFARYVVGGMSRLVRKIERDPTRTIAERILCRSAPRRRVLMERLVLWVDSNAEGEQVYVFKDHSQLPFLEKSL